MKKIKKSLLKGSLARFCTLLFLVFLALITMQILGYSKDYNKLFLDINENGLVFYDEGHKMKIRVSPELRQGNALSEQRVIENYLNLMHTIEVYNKNVMLRISVLSVLCFILSLILVVLYFVYEIIREAREVSYQRELAQKDQLLFHYAQLSTVGKVAGDIIHQWKQPLNNLMLIISNMESCVEEGDYELLDDLSQDAREAISLLSGTISDFRGMLVTEHQDAIFDIQDLVHYVLGFYATKLDLNGITCKVNFEGNLRISGKKSQLLQVLSNLLDNAADAVTESHLFDGLIVINCIEQLQGVMISIKDNGGGVADEISSQIFETYVTSKGGKGSGLGLSISRDIITTHFNGQLSFHNVDNGAEFEIFIPRFGGENNG